MTNEATPGVGNGAVENRGFRPSDTMVRYDSPSEQGQNAALPESNEGQVSEASGTEQAASTANEAVPAGVNTNSPEYRHFQSVADKRIAEIQNATKAEMAKFQEQIAALQAKLSAQDLQRVTEQKQPVTDQSGFGLDFSQAPRLQLPEGAYLDEATATALDKAVNDRIQWTIAQIEQRQQAAVQQQQLTQAAQQLVGFAQGLPPAKQVEFMGLVQQYEPIARQDPAAFVKFAQTQLGMDSAPKAAETAPPKLVQPSQAIPSQRPTNNPSGLAPRRDPNETLRDIVQRNVRKAYGA